MSEKIIIAGKNVEYTHFDGYVKISVGIDDLEWAGEGLYVCYAEPQADGTFGSTTRLWQSMQDYRWHGIQGSHGGTPILIHSANDWISGR